MFDRKLIPTHNPALKQHLQNIFSQISGSSDVKSVIDKKVEKVNQNMKDKIVNTVTISGYFDQLWQQPDLKQHDKNLAIRLLEGRQALAKVDIKSGYVELSKTRGNLNIINAEFQMTPFEDFNYQEKLKGIRKHKQLDIESDLFTHHGRDREVLHALNKPFRSVPNLNSPEFLHYTAGLCDTEEAEEVKNQKAENFVKKVKDDRRAFVRKMKEIEKTEKTRENDELERYRLKEQQDQEKREKEKKHRLEAHIKELKARNEHRIHESSKWEEQYKSHMDSKPLFKEIEQRFKKEQMMPELNDRKKKLQELRDFYKPMAHEDILDHEKKYLKLHEEKEAERKEQIMENSRWIYQKPAYESRHHKSYAEEISRLRTQKESSHMEAMKKKERIAELLEEVKQNHLPKPDPQKELELAGIVEKLKQRKDGRSRTVEEDDDLDVDPRKLGIEYLKSVKEMVQKSKKHKISATKDDISSHGLPSDRNRDKAGATSQSEPMPVHKPRNYLAELRKENKIKDSNNQVDSIIHNKKIAPEERKNLLQSEVEKLEAKTRRKEEVKKYKSRRNMSEIDQDDEEVDMMYINTIKAKLEMLGS